MLIISAGIAMSLGGGAFGQAVPMPTPPGGGPGGGGPGGGGGGSQPGQPPGCGNHEPTTPPQCHNSTSCPDCPQSQGSNPFNVSTADVTRNVRDLDVFGGVGEHQLNWTRYGHSRIIGGNRWFGDGHTWRHSYQWEMTQPGSSTIQIIYPDGTVNVYTGGSAAWTGLASNTDLLSQTGTNYYLRQDDGITYHFAKSSGTAGISFAMTDFTDSIGNSYVLTYDAQQRLVRVAEPAGRWLRISYGSPTVNQEQFHAFFANKSAPPAGWNTVAVTDTNAYRYLRYYSTDPGSEESHCDIAEIQFYDKNGVLLSGSVFGSSPASSSTNGFANAFDGNTSTYFDYKDQHFGFVGIDLGPGNASAVGTVKFFPRAGYESRMVGTNGEGHPTGCRFEGGNTAPIVETVITQVAAGYTISGSDTITKSVSYQYAALADPVLATNWLCLGEADYSDGTAGRYTYQSIFAGQQPVLFAADDPRFIGNTPRIIYEFWQNTDWVFGAIYAEHDFTTNQILARLNGEGSGGYSATGRAVGYANGGTRHLVIDGNGNASSFIDEMGYTTTYNHGANNGFLASMTDPLGRTTSYTRDAQARLLSVAYPDQTSESWTRDALGHVLTHTDQRNNTTTYTRDSHGRPTRISYPDGSSESFTYNGFGQTLTHTLKSGGVETYAYDARGLPLTRADALGNTTAYSYGANDLPASETDALGRSTGFAFDEVGRLAQVGYADGSSIAMTYDPYGDLLSKTNEIGKTWRYAYDEFKRRITATDPLNRITQYFYDEPGTGCGGCGSNGGSGTHLTTMILPSGKTTRNTYDLAWRRTSQSAGYGTADIATTQYGYDSAGNLTTVTDPNGKVWSYAYDARDRRTSATDPLGRVNQWAYDAAGNRTTETRPDGGVTAHSFDTLNRIVSTTNPKSQTTGFGYDQSGNLISLTDARSDTYTFGYDLLSRKLSMGYPDGSAERWSYDAVGNIATYTTRAGQARTSAYDSRNRETAYTWSDSTPSVTESYDPAGRLLAMSSSVSALSYAYDDADQLLGETTQVNGDSAARTIGYGYDPDGNRASATYPDGTVVSSTYSGRNQVSGIAANGSAVASYRYDANGNTLQKTLGNGTVTAFTYDTANELLGVAHQRGGAAFDSLGYTYNSVGDRTARSEALPGGAAVTDGYGYDAIDQVTSVAYGSGRNVGYAYDAAGNRTSMSDNGNTTTYAANNLNQYSAISGTAPGYDANGNLTASGSWSYGYDAQNRMVAASSGTGGVSAVFAYDPRNRCVSRTINGATTFYTYDRWTLIQEQNSTGELARYISGPRTDEMLAMVSGTSTAYYHQDGLGSTVSLTDSTGNLIETCAYDVYGQPSFKTPSGVPQSASTIGNRFLFTGREWISQVNLYDYRNRVYSQDLGRFEQVDPIRFAASRRSISASRSLTARGLGVNVYEYSENDPIDRVDPSGLDSFGTLNLGSGLVLKFQCNNGTLVGVGIVLTDFDFASIQGITIPPNTTAAVIVNPDGTITIGVNNSIQYPGPFGGVSGTEVTFNADGTFKSTDFANPLIPQSIVNSRFQKALAGQAASIANIPSELQKANCLCKGK